MATLFLDFLRNSILFSLVAAPIYVPTVWEGALFSIPSPAFIVCLIILLQYLLTSCLER